MIKLKSLVAAAATTIGLIATPAFAQQEVVWWDFLGGGDGVRMKALIERFNSEHSDIQINGTTLEWGVPFYVKVRTSAAVGQGPDVMTYHLSRMPLGISEGVLSPITDEDLTNADLSTDDFFEKSISAATGEDGSLYAIPFDIHSLVLYYNKDLLKGSPFIGDDGKLTGISSLEDLDAAVAAAKGNGSVSPISYATADDGGTYRVFYTLFSQMGGELIVDGEVLPGDNAAKAQKAIEIMTQWRNDDVIPEQAEYGASVALFTSGKSAFHLNGVWEVPTMIDLAADNKLGFEWGAAQVPTVMETTATWADSHAFAIPDRGDNALTPEKRAAVMTVVGWMQKNALSWATAGHIPAYKPVAESDEFKKMEPNASYSSLANTAAYDPQSVIAGVASPVYDAAINLISPAVHGFLSAEDAVAQMKEDLQSKLH